MGDQPQAIDDLSDGLEAKRRYQVLLGATGTGKTFTIANVIARANKPTLLISHNKTLAAQLYEEMKELFPHNAVSYFVSYYDFYQPEAYIPARDIFIEKDASRNADLDRLRLAATSHLLSRRDSVVPLRSWFAHRVPQQDADARSWTDHRATRVSSRALRDEVHAQRNRSRARKLSRAR